MFCFYFVAKAPSRPRNWKRIFRNDFWVFSTLAREHSIGKAFKNYYQEQFRFFLAIILFNWSNLAWLVCERLEVVLLSSSLRQLLVNLKYLTHRHTTSERSCGNIFHLFLWCVFLFINVIFDLLTISDVVDSPQIFLWFIAVVFACCMMGSIYFRREIQALGSQLLRLNTHSTTLTAKTLHKTSKMSLVTVPGLHSFNRHHSISDCPGQIQVKYSIFTTFFVCSWGQVRIARVNLLCLADLSPQNVHLSFSSWLLFSF